MAHLKLHIFVQTFKTLKCTLHRHGRNASELGQTTNKAAGPPTAHLTVSLIPQAAHHPSNSLEVGLVYSDEHGVQRHLHSTQVEVVKEDGQVAVQSLGGTEVKLQPACAAQLHLVPSLRPENGMMMMMFSRTVHACLLHNATMLHRTKVCKQPQWDCQINRKRKQHTKNDMQSSGQKDSDKINIQPCETPIC